MSQEAAALAAFVIAAGLLTVTPGLDTALMLRTSASEGPRRAAAAGAGILAGCLIWGLVVAVGLGALLEASRLAYDILKWAGAAWLVWLGVGLLFRPRSSLAGAGSAGAVSALAWFRRGLLTNILNPKIGVFYVSFLPQFIPDGASVPFWSMGLACIHALVGALWFGVLILAGSRVAALLRRPSVIAWLDRLTGALFIGFAARLALERTPD